MPQILDIDIALTLVMDGLLIAFMIKHEGSSELRVPLQVKSTNGGLPPNMTRSADTVELDVWKLEKADNLLRLNLTSAANEDLSSHVAAETPALNPTPTVKPVMACVPNCSNL